MNSESIVKEDIRIAEVYIEMAKAIKATILLYGEIIEKGYQPLNTLTAITFLDTMLNASKELTKMMEQHTVLVHAHTELGKM